MEMSKDITTIFKHAKLWIRLVDFTHVLKNENIWTDKKNECKKTFTSFVRLTIIILKERKEKQKNAWIYWKNRCCFVQLWMRKQKNISIGFENGWFLTIEICVSDLSESMWIRFVLLCFALFCSSFWFNFSFLVCLFIHWIWRYLPLSRFPEYEHILHPWYSHSLRLRHHFHVHCMWYKCVGQALNSHS